jgi:hypothetical protein
MRPPRIQLRTLMFGIAFLALILTVIVQATLLRRAAFTQQVLRNEANLQRARHMADVQRMLAISELQRATVEAARYRPPAEPGQGTIQQLLHIRRQPQE